MHKSAIRFSDSDLASFAAASGDQNPLHRSVEYATKTSYGEPVVFGALGAVACLSALELPAGAAIATLQVEFDRPMVCGVSYELVAAAESRDRISIRILDGSVCLLTLSVTLRAANGSDTLRVEDEPAVAPPLFTRTEARPYDQSEFFLHGRDLSVLAHAIIASEGKVSGKYGADWAAAKTLQNRWPISPAKQRAFLTLLFSSYLVGMELPGEPALFSRVLLDFSGANGHPAMPLEYCARVESFDERLDKLRIAFEAMQGADLIARGSAWAFVRLALPPLETASMQSWLPASTLLAGQVALVVGATRGLGGVAATMLASQGCEVIGNYHRSSDDAERVAAGAALLSGRISLARGDASDFETCQELKRRILGNHGRLDILVCNASPPIPALRLEENALSRIQSHIARAVSLVATPMSVFLPLLERSAGTFVAISSIYAEQPVKEFPHYVAGKKAIEGLAEVAALQYPKIRVVVQRPPKILTALTNTPMGRRNAAPAEQVAARLVSYLCSNPEPGLHII